jgi:hypothetical protein
MSAYSTKASRTRQKIFGDANETFSPRTTYKLSRRAGEGAAQVDAAAFRADFLSRGNK